ncbi:MAG: M14 family zinc carboxypeptidase [Solirubrobacteraceae bacterium]
MRRRATGAALAAFAAFAVAAPAQAAGSKLEAYELRTNAETISTLAQEGFDMTEARSGGQVEIIATGKQAKELRRLGLKPKLRRDENGVTALQFDAAAQRADGSYDVYRPYFDDTYVGTQNPDGTGPQRQTLYEELSALAADNPSIVKAVEIGRTIQDKPILALKVTKDAGTEADGTKPAVLYSATQHAREWLATETDRRLLHLFVDNYGGTGAAKDQNGGDLPDVTAEELTELVDTRELWFVVVANPDGYDYTFTPGNRLWRKNLRDNNGNGTTEPGDGVDPNRNYPTKFKYDDEGSSSDPFDETYRGTGPASEPETRALDGLLRDIGFAFQVNYHTAAQLLLYPFGFQVETYTADDPIYRALSGTDADSAIKGIEPGAPNDYDPDVGAELYTTNGETTDHAHTAYGTLAWTPELDVADPERGGGQSVLEFQDSEADVSDVLVKNIAFALDVARSAADPANPVSHLGTSVPNFEVETFSTSYGTPQLVEANVKRELGPVAINWRVNGGPVQTAATSEWNGGERFGDVGDVYYHRVRGSVTGTKAGDDVTVWFTAGDKRSGPFTYATRVASTNPVLILAAEDYSGHSPDYADNSAPAYLGYYTEALKAAGIGYDVYDVDARGRRAPDPLGVLSHYKVIVWYTGDDRRVIEPDQPPTGAGASRLSDDLYRAVRSYLNGGGKLLFTGEQAGFDLSQQFSYNTLGGPPYCDSGATPGYACIPLSDDFLQYYLGSYKNNAYATSKAQLDGLGVSFTGDPFGPLGVTLNGAGSADNQDAAYSLTPTSSVLPVAEYPQFASQSIAGYSKPGPLQPKTGQYYVYSQQTNAAYKRLTRTVDLTGATSGKLKFTTSYDLEPDYDYLFVEAHTVGQEDWTTLPDANGQTSQELPAAGSCADGWGAPGGTHPFLSHYQDPTTCAPTGTSGAWHAATGSSQGFQDWEIDLSSFANKQVEVSIVVATDPAVQNVGAFVDDTVVEVGGQPVVSTSFEDGLGGWSIGAAPAGSPALVPANSWLRSTAIFEEAAGVKTADTVYYGFGLECVDGAAQRADLMARSLRYLGVTGNPGAGKAKVRIKSGRRLRADRQGRVKVKVACVGDTGARCQGKVRIGKGASATARRPSRSAPARPPRSA